MLKKENFIKKNGHTVRHTCRNKHAKFHREIALVRTECVYCSNEHGESRERRFYKSAKEQGEYLPPEEEKKQRGIEEFKIKN